MLSKIEVRGDKELYAKFMRINALGYSETFQEIGRELVDIFGGLVFASRGGAIGKSWAPLKATTGRGKATSYAGRPPLVQTGAMRGAFEAQASEFQVVITNSDFKFPFHQLGTSRGIPARKMTGAGGVVRPRTEPIFRRGVMQKVRQAWAT